MRSIHTGVLVVALLAAVFLAASRESRTLAQETAKSPSRALVGKKSWLYLRGSEWSQFSIRGAIVAVDDVGVAIDAEITEGKTLTTHKEKKPMFVPWSAIVHIGPWTGE